MAEWSKAPALKTGDVKASVGSTPTLSAKKTSTDGIAGINACGDAWSSRKQEYSVGWLVVSEATTSTLGELNTCAGYTPPLNNRVVYHKRVVISVTAGYTPPGNNRVVYQNMGMLLSRAGYTPPRNNRVVYQMAFEQRDATRRTLSWRMLD